MKRAVLMMVVCLSSCYRDLPDLVPFPCSTTNECPGGYSCVDKLGCVPLDVCSVDDQDCSSSDRDKCVVVRLSDNTDHTTCLPESGSNALGETCARNTLGVDNCAPGLFCNSGFSPDGSFACRSYCEDDTQCPTSMVCADAFVPVTAGICVPSCVIGQTCDSMHSCRGVGSSRGDACTVDGSVGLWGACSATEGCGHNLECIVAPGSVDVVCMAQCGGSLAACSQGHTCSSFGGTQVCQCDLFAGCGLHTSCRPEGTDATSYMGVCSSDGTATRGQSCDTVACGPDLSCYGSSGGGYVCRDLCDATHNCAVGSCHQLPNLPRNGGICL